MKKLCLSLLVVLLLCGCSTGSGSESKAQFGKYIGKVGWVTPPSMVLNAVEMLAAYPPLGFPYVEKTGHPQEWDYMAGKGPFIVDEAEYIGPPVYTCNAISVFGDGFSAVYDYDGNLLNEKAPSYFMTDAGFGYDYFDEGYCSVFSSDFMSTVNRNVIDGLCGGNLGLFEYKGILQTDVLDPRNTSVDILGIGCMLFMPSDSANIEKETQFRPATKEDLFGHRALADVFTSKYVYGERKEDLALYDENMERLYVIEHEDNKFLDSFVNGFITFRYVQKNSEGSWTNKYGFYDADKREYITEFEYDEVQPFVEGYAGVKKDEKWAFIDETGMPVTDFIFDSISTMYEGKVYVGLKDRFGILDLKETLSRGIAVTMETCYGSSDEEEAYKNLTALEVYVPKQKQRDPAIVEEEEKYEKEHQILGKITPKVNNINIRSGPSTQYDKVGRLTKVESFYSEYYRPQYFYETSENEGYTWYRIGTDRWVANDGTWYDVVFYNNEKSK